MKKKPTRSDLKPQTRKEPTRKRKPVDRSQQGAALAGTPNVPEEKTEKKVDSAPPVMVESSQSSITTTDSTPAQEPAARKITMTLTYKGASKNGKVAFYTGARNVQRFAVSSFVNGAPPPTFDVQEGVFEGPKAKLTPEERKAARANAPKPTKAEKLAKMREKLARLEAAAAAENAAAV